MASAELSASSRCTATNPTGAQLANLTAARKEEWVLDSPEGAAIRRMYGESINGRLFDVVLAHDWFKNSCNKNFLKLSKFCSV